MHNRKIICAALVLALSGSAAALAQDTGQQLQQGLDAIRAQNGFPGALLTAKSDGTVYQLRSGTGNLATGERVPFNTQFRIGSISKTFVSTVVLQLVGEGKFTLDSKLSSLLKPQQIAAVPFADQITVRQLLEMTSGVYEYNDAQFQQILFKRPRRRWLPQQLVNSIQGKPPFFEPGASCSSCPCNACSVDDCQAGGPCFHYSNTNYILLGMIVEKYTKRTLAEEIERRILKPLHLHSTSLPDDLVVPGHHSRGYMPEELSNGKCLPVFTHAGENLADATDCVSPTAAWAAGAMLSNLPDLDRWVDALINGTLLSPRLHDEQFTFVNGNIGGVAGIPIQYGLGVMKFQNYIGHGGEFFGYSSVMFKNQICNDTILDMINSFPEPDDHASYYETFLMADSILCAGANQLSPAAADQLRRAAETRKSFLGLTWQVFP